MKNSWFLLISVLVCLSVKAQYPPSAGQEGSTAIHKDSSIFIDWANNCIVQRGYLDISMPDSGFVSAGEAIFATGKADNFIISLGDEGSATLTFDKPIQNGPGPDFAVFENSFTDDFLELAFVEVSSNGIDYIRFPAISLTQTNEQIGPFGSLDATKIHNLAGKYRGFYGVPFDLEDIEPAVGIDAYQVTQVRLISVTGSIDDEFASFDSQENVINDPWPTMFASGGFDLDAVGVINNSANSTQFISKNNIVRIFPNPAENYINLHFYSDENPIDYSILDIYGERIIYENLKGLELSRIDLAPLPKGIYLFKINFKDFQITQKFIKK